MFPNKDIDDSGGADPELEDVDKQEEYESPRAVTLERQAQIAVFQAKTVLEANLSDEGSLNDCRTHLNMLITENGSDFRDDTCKELIQMFTKVGQRLSSIRNNAVQQAQAAHTSNPIAVSSKKYPSHVRLDDVPKYDGHPSSWKRFVELFKDAVGANPNLTDALKLDTLSKVVVGHTQAVLSYDNWQAAISGLTNELADDKSVENDLYRLAQEANSLPANPGLGNWMTLKEDIQNMQRRCKPYGTIMESHIHLILQRKLGRFKRFYDHKSKNENLDHLLAYVNKEVKACQKLEREHAMSVSVSSFVRPDQNGSNRNVSPTNRCTLEIGRASCRERV